MCRCAVVCQAVEAERVDTFEWRNKLAGLWVESVSDVDGGPVECQDGLGLVERLVPVGVEGNDGFGRGQRVEVFFNDVIESSCVPTQAPLLLPAEVEVVPFFRFEILVFL